MPTEPPEVRTSERTRARRGLRAVAVTVVAVTMIAGGALFALTESIGGNVERVPDVFEPLDDAVRPPATEAVTFVLVGTDTRSDEPTTGADAAGSASAAGGRSDVLMIARVEPDRRAATVISIPRDSWVAVPGRGMNKVNAAYAFGGPPLLIRTVEQLTGQRIDHFAVIDFVGFTALVDAVGGIDVTVSVPTTDRGVRFHQGVNHLDGASALVYARQRYGLPDGDLDRAKRHQSVIRALLSKAVAEGVLTDPAKLLRFLDAASRSVSVDDSLSNTGLGLLAFELRHLRPLAVDFVSAPVRGLGFEGPQSVVYLDQQRSSEMWAALRDGSMRAYLARVPGEVLDAGGR